MLNTMFLLQCSCFYDVPVYDVTIYDANSSFPKLVTNETKVWLNFFALLFNTKSLFIEQTGLNRSIELQEILMLPFYPFQVLTEFFESFLPELGLSLH